jgi:hypothetical protein
MKKLTSFFLMCLFAGQAFSQIRSENPDPFLFRPVTHSGNLKSSENKLQGKSFYQSKSDWQTIIDTTWGPGLPLNEKLAIFDTYTGDLTARFAGFIQLGIDPTEWDSIKSSYRSRIDSSTSKGAFAALMGHLVYDLHDGHVRACDTTVLYTKLNPGIPILVIGAGEISHFGAVLTVLPDSSLLVLRTIDEHPLGLQPGDIVLGYEGVPWKSLVDELLGSGIPLLAWSRDAKSALRYHELVSAGMNWHLFETIDIVKYASGDTVHLPVYPMVNLPVPPTGSFWWAGKGPVEGLMWNNEQLPVPGVPFPDPDKFDERSVTYGIVEGTNIGYIYLYAEIYKGIFPGCNYNADDQFYEAVRSLLGTEGLIIDLRINFGGFALFDKAFNLLFNSRQATLEGAVRCNQTDFSLCPANDQSLFLITGNPMSWYDRPMAILTGPNCASNGDMTAYRFGYHPMARFFGKSTTAALTYYEEIGTYPEWILWNQYAEMYRVNDPDVFLSRREFPVDDSVWFDKESVAAGKDAVVQKAMEWIQNLSYAHNILVNPIYAVLGEGTVTLTAKVENPNDHNLSVNARITSLDSTINETVSLFDDGNHNDGDPGDGTWGATWPVPDMKTIFSADVTTEDLTAGTSRSIPGAAKFTTIGPVVFDGITYRGNDTIPNPGDRILITMTLRNNDLAVSAVKLQVKLTSLDTTLANIIPDPDISLADIAPGKISRKIPFKITISEDCPVDTVISFKVDISGDFYTFWIDTFSITVLATTNINAEDISKPIARIYPNPTADIINIEISNTGGQEIEIELLTITGQVIYRKDYKNSQGYFTEQIDLSGYARGLYFVKIRQSGAVYNGKIIVM